MYCENKEKHSYKVKTIEDRCPVCYQKSNEKKESNIEAEKKVKMIIDGEYSKK